MFDNRFRFDFTYYRTRSYNQIMQAPIAASSGFDRVTFNTGEMENKGFEVTTGFDITRQKDWDWQVGLNLAHNNNRLLSMSDGVNVFEIGQIFGGNGPVVQVEVGDSYGNLYGWDYARNEKGQKIIDVIYDKNDPTQVAGTIYRTTRERVKLGNITPDVIGGINTNLRWKNFSLYALAGFSFGGDIWSGTYAASISGGLSPSTLAERNGGGLPYTYPDGTTANHGVILDGVLPDGTANTHVVHYIWKYAQSTAWGESGKTLNANSILRNDWVKLNEVTLSYQLPQHIVKQSRIFQNLGLMVSARDLFYLYASLPDKLNPEALSNSAGNAQGLEFGALPGMRSFSFTLKAEF
jgi:iron complex outermembrane receptor protein